MNNEVITQHYLLNDVTRPAQPAMPSFLTNLRRQVNEDLPTFILTRLVGILIIMNIVNQASKLKGWW